MIIQLFGFSEIAKLVALLLIGYKCIDGLGDTPNIMRLAHTAVILDSPDSHESGETASRRIGARDENDRGVPIVRDGSADEADIVAPGRKSASPVR